jgi:hypothetical protein
MTNMKFVAGKWPVATILLAISAIASVRSTVMADQGGISFWLPGFGSLAAAPGQPGLSFPTLYVHTSVAAGGNKSFALNGQIVAALKGGANVVDFGPTYIFETPVFGGQASLSLFGAGGRSDASISATLTGPRGNTLSGTRTCLADGFC